MALILCIETTTTNCSVSLGENGSLLALKELNNKGYSHAEKLHLFIQAVLKEAQKELSDIEAVAVSEGPGSYTGLRIGVSTAKGLCFALDIPLLAIETLRLLKEQVPEPEAQFVIPMLDARRMEVYNTVFQGTQKLVPTTAQVLDENSFSTFLAQGKCLFIGTGVQKFKERCTHPNATFKPAFPSSKEMVLLAQEQFQNKEVVNLAYFEPFYLKDFLIKMKSTSSQ